MTALPQTPEAWLLALDPEADLPQRQNISGPTANISLGLMLGVVLATVLVGPINLAVSFYLAFRLALKAQGVSEVNRRRIQVAIRHRLRRAPWSFLWPLSDKEAAAADAGADISPAHEVPRG